LITLNPPVDYWIFAVLAVVSVMFKQNLGIDYHAATEELYYYMRKKDQDIHTRILEFIDRFYGKIVRSSKS
jgi:hypothetical protein